VIESFWRDVEAILDSKSLLKHPFYQAWTMGKLTREDLAYYSQQYFQQEARFPRYVSAVHSNCPEIKTRQMLLENLTHEESGPENHPELWLAFAGAVGAPRWSMAASFFWRLSASRWVSAAWPAAPSTVAPSAQTAAAEAKARSMNQ